MDWPGFEFPPSVMLMISWSRSLRIANAALYYPIIKAKVPDAQIEPPAHLQNLEEIYYIKTFWIA